MVQWPTRNPHVHQFVQKVTNLCEPRDVHFCTGEENEDRELIQLLIKNGTLKALNPAKRPNSFIAWSDPKDVARVEDRTFVCSESQAEAGPNNNWMAPQDMRAKLQPMFKGSMRGRTLYVIPFPWAPSTRPIP